MKLILGLRAFVVGICMVASTGCGSEVTQEEALNAGAASLKSEPPCVVIEQHNVTVPISGRHGPYEIPVYDIKDEDIFKLNSEESWRELIKSKGMGPISIIDDPRENSDGLNGLADRWNSFLNPKMGPFRFDVQDKKSSWSHDLATKCVWRASQPKVCSARNDSRNFNPSDEVNIRKYALRWWKVTHEGKKGWIMAKLPALAGKHDYEQYPRAAFTELVPPFEPFSLIASDECR